MTSLERLFEIYRQSEERNQIPNDLYHEYKVKKGLRNEDGTGVVVGLTKICDVKGYEHGPEGKVNCPGELYYRGYPLSVICRPEGERARPSYEEVCYLLLHGTFPTERELDLFTSFLRSEYELPDKFLAENIMAAPSINIMNKIQRAILMLYSEDENPDDPSIENTYRQGLSVLAKLPAIAVYSYEAKRHHINSQSLEIHPIQPEREMGMAEHILYLLGGDDGYTPEEVDLLDLMLTIHADHGIGNNSTFTSLVVSSTQTDFYSALTAAVGSLKGPRHGGANILCRHMMEEVIEDLGTDASDEEILDVVKRILARDYFDQSGLVYGIGHAVYTISDPRAVLLQEHARAVAEACGRLDELEFYGRFADIACAHIREVKGKDVCANVDLYSGLIYDMMGISEDLYTPLFVISRAIGWVAHTLEDKLNSDRIIRPAGIYIGEIKEGMDS